MKKLFFIALLSCFFFGCDINNFEQDNFVYISVDSEKTKNTESHTFNYPQYNYISLPLNQDIYLMYGTLPKDQAFNVLEIKSDNPEIISIINIDYSKQEITAHSNNTGRAKISIKTDSCYSSATLPIEVK